jgi:hypothetical protein
MDLMLDRLIRTVLLAFVVTFLVARSLVLLIMMRWIPDLFLYVGGTHVHHLNYGIFLLAGVGAFLLFRRPAHRELSAAATLYGVGLALTFDEFGMWLHLGGDYWMRTSFDAMVIIGGLLGLAAAAPMLRQFRPRHWVTAAGLALGVAIFAYLLWRGYHYATTVLMPHLRHLETIGPR